MVPIGDPRINPIPEPEEEHCPYGICNPKMNTSGHDVCKMKFGVAFKQHVNQKYGGEKVDLNPWHDEEEYRLRFEAWVALHAPIDTALDSGTITYNWSAQRFGDDGDNWDVFVDQMPKRRNR